MFYSTLLLSVIGKTEKPSRLQKYPSIYLLCLPADYVLH